MNSYQLQFGILIVSLCFFSRCTSEKSSLNDKQPARIQLHTESKFFTPGVPFEIAIEIELAEKYHTYWENPGDAGLAPEFKWDLPDGWQSFPIKYPVPERIIQNEIATFGYHDRVIFITGILPNVNVNDSVASLYLRANILVCKEACIQFSDTITINLQKSRDLKSLKTDSSKVGLFKKARSSLPETEFLKNAHWRLEDQNILIFFAKDTLIKNFDNVKFYPLTKGVFNLLKTEEVRITDSLVNISLFLSNFQSQQLKTIEGLLVYEKSTQILAIPVHATPYPTRRF